ncbi:MAG: small multi-drug export protein [Ilumatobacteraceae bacterium]
MFFDYVLVVILSILAGAWTIPTGITFGLNPVGVYVAAVLGAVIWTIIALALGGRGRDAVFERFLPGTDERVRESRAGYILERWGVWGLAVVGGLVLGPTVTLMAALVLGVERRRFAAWYIIATAVLFAVLTVFWRAVL